MRIESTAFRPTMSMHRSGTAARCQSAKPRRHNVGTPHTTSLPPATAVLSRLSAHGQLQTLQLLEARVLEHDIGLRRQEARLRQQRSASMLQLKWAGQQLFDAHELMPESRRIAPPLRSSQALQQLQHDYDRLQRDHARIQRGAAGQSQTSPTTPRPESEAVAQSLAACVRELEQENAELRAALLVARGDTQTSH